MASRTALVVDDDPDIVLVFRVMLDAEGFRTVSVANGRAAVEEVLAGALDVVLLDVMMPELDGWGVLEALADHEGAPPVVVVSARVGEADQQRALRLGAAAYVTKPFDPEELLRTVESVLDGRPSVA
jgi:CheY-like chemotaxis protein